MYRGCGMEKTRCHICRSRIRTLPGFQLSQDNFSAWLAHFSNQTRSSQFLLVKIPIQPITSEEIFTMLSSSHTHTHKRQCQVPLMADSLPAHPTEPRPFSEPEEGMIWGEFCVKCGNLLCCLFQLTLFKTLKKKITILKVK